MDTVSLELPIELVKLAQLDTGDLSHETAKILALDLFRERKVSLGRAAELCATPLAAFMDFAAAHGVPPLSYDLEDLEHDRNTMIAKLRS
jgi:predicted HTH domain antitoxin